MKMKQMMYDINSYGWDWLIRTCEDGVMAHITSAELRRAAYNGVEFVPGRNSFRAFGDSPKEALGYAYEAWVRVIT